MHVKARYEVPSLEMACGFRRGVVDRCCRAISKTDPPPPSKGGQFSCRKGVSFRCPPDSKSIENRLYDLQRYPDELHDVADAHPGEMRDLSRAVQLWREREDSMVLSDEVEIADPSVREQLRSLGCSE